VVKDRGAGFGGRRREGEEGLPEVLLETKRREKGGCWRFVDVVVDVVVKSNWLACSLLCLRKN